MQFHFVETDAGLIASVEFLNPVLGRDRGIVERSARNIVQHELSGADDGCPLLQRAGFHAAVDHHCPVR